MDAKRYVVAAALSRLEGNPQLVLEFEDGECVAQDLDEVSYQGWLDEGLGEMAEKDRPITVHRHAPSSNA